MYRRSLRVEYEVLNMQGNKRRDGKGIRKEMMMKSATEVYIRYSYMVGA